VRGFVPTPPAVVDVMVEKLFRIRPPTRTTRVLDAGCGYGAFIQGVLGWARRHQLSCPSITGIELDPKKVEVARIAFKKEPQVNIVCSDFLVKHLEPFDYIIANPPYVSIGDLSDTEKAAYRARFQSARGRLDLYLLFLERALGLLKPGGRLVFITPEKFTYVESARGLRQILSRFHVEEIDFAPEDTFPGLTTYPAVTTINSTSNAPSVRVRLRDGARRLVTLPSNGDSWLPYFNGSPRLAGAKTLSEVSLRVSCGVATGADSIFLFDSDELPKGFSNFAYPTLSGRELRVSGELPSPTRVLLTPYDEQGNLLLRKELGPVDKYLATPRVRAKLESRTCVRRKPWYAFHDTPHLDQILRPKILCKDITSRPYFWMEKRGDIVPLHSTYYIVPDNPDLLEPLAAFLNSKSAGRWLRANCQRAANEYYRVQSAILKRLPIPDELSALA
jgi:adenine-specific DNA-methyltransferase